MASYVYGWKVETHGFSFRSLKSMTPRYKKKKKKPLTFLDNWLSNLHHLPPCHPSASECAFSTFKITNMVTPLFNSRTSILLVSINKPRAVVIFHNSSNHFFITITITSNKIIAIFIQTREFMILSSTRILVRLQLYLRDSSHAHCFISIADN